MSRRRKGTGLVVAGVVGGLACQSPQPAPLPVTPPAPPASVVSTASAAPVATDPAPVETAQLAPPPDPAVVLKRFAVHHDSPAVRELYTWTTDEQIAALRKDPTLLVRSESPRFGSSYFDRVMDARGAKGDRVARLLRTQAFAKARFAWPAAWATVLGWPGETYGKRLVRVVLKEGSLVAAFRDGSTSWRLFEVGGAEASVNDFLSKPERLAAVYFVHDGDDPANASGRGRLHYREYVLVNESRIELYEVGTQPVLEEVGRGIDAIERMLASSETGWDMPSRIEAVNKLASSEVWPAKAHDGSALSAWLAALAFPNDLYLPKPRELRALVAALRALPATSPPMSHRPTLAFKRSELVPNPQPRPYSPRRARARFGGTF